MTTKERLARRRFHKTIMPKKQTYPTAIVSQKHEDAVEIDPKLLVVFSEHHSSSGYPVLGHRDPYILGIRSGGPFAKKSFFLNEDYNWIIACDGEHHLVLIPTKK